jgi:hypothetical protein
VAWKKVEFKLAQAERALGRLLAAKNREEFYDHLASFLSSARSVVSVLAFQFGFEEFKTGQKRAGTNRHLGLSTAELQKRQSFDTWLKSAAATVLSHPLKADRDSDGHREGTPSAKFRLPPGTGLLLEPGGPIDRPLVLRRNNIGQRGFGLPLEEPRPQDFYFEFDNKRSAIQVCRDYLGLIKKLLEAAKVQV